MKTTTQKLIALVALISLSLGSLTSCKKDAEDPKVVQEGIARAALIFTTLAGESIEAHGIHFHGLDGAVEGESITVAFDEKGIATQNGHLHLSADATYKVELKVWDYNNKELQQDYIRTKDIADQYKAFLVGGNFVLNPNSPNESGAIFQPREAKYGDDTVVNGQYETTGLLSYFTIGDDNVGATKQVRFILRKLEAGIKAEITRIDWNRDDYSSQFSGVNLLELKFEIHVGDGHAH